MNFPVSKHLASSYFCYYMHSPPAFVNTDPQSVSQPENGQPENGQPENGQPENCALTVQWNSDTQANGRQALVPLMCIYLSHDP